jgi:hypothetical protein
VASAAAGSGAEVGWIQGTPGYFNDDGFQAFQRMATEPSDVVMTSYPKCGTSWLHGILFCLLRMDERGAFAAPLETLVGSSGQAYPDAMPAKRQAGAQAAVPRPGDKPGGGMGGWCFEDMLVQPAPRLFTTHIRASNLPPSLSVQGKLVVIARNPKDGLVSSFFFQKKLAELPAPMGPHAAQGLQRGIEGAFEDWCQEIDPADIPHGGYGDYYTYYEEQVALLEQLGAQRGLMTFYETLQTDFEGEVARIAEFLGVPLPRAKLDALAGRCAMEAAVERGQMTARKGVVGDHQQHLTPARWAEVDVIFADRLGGVEQFAPLLPYMG